MRLLPWAFLVVVLLAPACEETGYYVLDDDDATDVPGGDDDMADDDDSAGDDDTTPPPPQGVYLAPDLSFEVPLPCFGNQGMALFNDTQLDVLVENIHLASEDSSFELIFPQPPPWTLAAGESQPFAVLFEPPGLGVQTMVVEAITDHPDYTSVAADLTGEGVPDDEWMDVFYAEDASMVDVLFVVDNSCSMPEEQVVLADTAAAFVAFLASEGLDYRIGVVTTDDATLQGADPVIAAGDTDPAASLAAAVQLGTVGSGYEQPLSYGLHALSPPMVDLGGANEGFLREAAGLAVILVTDEDDQSAGAAADYTTGFDALKADPTHVTVSAIDGGPAGCTGAGGQAYPATRIGEVVTDTGGVEGSICDEDWMPVLETIPSMVARPQSTFCLTFAPIPESLEVTVAGELLPEGWSWDEASNCIVLDSDHVPVPGDEVLVYYGEPAPEC
jgi:hypothetical protein